MASKLPTTVDSALLALEAGRRATAFRALKRLAESDDAGAFHMLGYLYDVGEGTRRDSKKAMFWYLRGYESGRSVSATNIATMYRDAGDAKNEYEWYRKAAALNDGDAELEVAIRLLSGKGVRRNLRMAVLSLRRVLKVNNTSDAARDTARQLLRGCVGGRRTA
jgi:TPR repeat protein